LFYSRISLLNVMVTKPFFFFVNLNEPHNPYNSSGQFFGTFVSDPDINLFGHRSRLFYLKKRTYTADELTHLNELYDAEILYVDYIIGRIIDELKMNGVWDNTIFIVTADHGENIGDHDHVDHMFSLYETTVAIPLIIHYPPLFPPNTKDYESAQIIDIFPTLLNIIGLDSENTHGIDLLDGEKRKARPVICEYYLPVQALWTFGKRKDSEALSIWKRRLRSIIYEDKKLILASDGKHEMYDLVTDPEELHNLIGLSEYSTDFHELKSRLKLMVDTHQRKEKQEEGPVPSEEALDEATREALRNLGYLE